MYTNTSVCAHLCYWHIHPIHQFDHQLLFSWAWFDKSILLSLLSRCDVRLLKVLHRCCKNQLLFLKLVTSCPEKKFRNCKEKIWSYQITTYCCAWKSHLWLFAPAGKRRATRILQWCDCSQSNWFFFGFITAFQMWIQAFKNRHESVNETVQPSWYWKGRTSTLHLADTLQDHLSHYEISGSKTGTFTTAGI